MYDMSVTTSGPMFDEARIAAVMRRTIATGEKTIADEGVKIIRRNLDKVLKHPTGYYRSQVRATAFGSLYEITDFDVIYGGWLERGWTETRFRGYATFRRSLQQIQAVSVEVMERRVLPVTVRELGGG
jgi:hypothetical protein